MSDLTPFTESLQILPPFNNAEQFENFITDFFNKSEDTTSYDRFGRSGQKQEGLDVFSYEKRTVIQCKVKKIDRTDNKIRKELIDELKNDFNQFKNYNKQNGLSYSRFILASTYKPDTLISTECSKLSTDDLQVEYWSWDKLSKQIPIKTQATYYPDFVAAYNKYYTVPDSDDELITLKIDKTKPVLDQIYDYITKRHEEINYFPIHLFKNGYPFKKDESFYPYYTRFTLSIDNDELFNFFKSVKIENAGKLIFTESKFIEGVVDYRKKTKKILKELSANLIFYLESNGQNKQLNIRYFEYKKCNCVRCLFARLEFGKAFEKLSKSQNKIDDKFKLAYMHYQIGNYVTSAKLLEKLSIEAKRKNLNVRYFISLYNLSKLQGFIRTRYWKNPDVELLSKIRKINLRKKFNEVVNVENEKLLEWIYEDSFYSEAKNTLTKLSTKIRDQYYSYQKGGWSSNSNVSELINEFAEMMLFLKSNYIFYEEFQEFNDISDIFIEALFASHAVGKNHGNRLEYFDDWMIGILIFYGSAEIIQKYFKRYELKEIVYKKTSREGDNLIQLLSNLLGGHDESVKAFSTYCEHENRDFNDKYNNIFSNLMTVTGIADLNENDINDIAKKLLIFLKREKVLHPASLKHINFFISKKGKVIEQKLLEEFLFLNINSRKFHSEEKIEVISRQLSLNNRELDISTSNYELFSAMAFEKCPICEGKHSGNFLISLYQIVNNKMKQKIKRDIETNLRKKFDVNLYYMAAIHDIVGADRDFLNQFIIAAKPSQNRKSVFAMSFNDGGVAKYQMVDELINVCFKYDIDLTKDTFKDFKGLSNYYDWLLNMKEFDYNLFNPLWVNQHATEYYFKEIRKHVVIKEKIWEYLKGDFNLQLERNFIRLYH